MPESQQSILLLRNFISERHWRLSVHMCAFECAPCSGYICIFVNFSHFLLTLCEVAGSLFCVLAALCFQFVLFCVGVFFPFFFVIFPGCLPTAAPRRLKWHPLFPSTLLPPSSSFPTYLHRSRVSIRFGTLTSLYRFSSFFLLKHRTSPSQPSLLSNL